MDSNNTTLTFKLRSSGIGIVQTIFREGSQHAINVEASAVAGGRDEAPSPITYVLSSLLSSLQITAQLVAKDFGVELNDFEFHIEAKLETAVFIDGAEEGNPNIQDIVIQVAIETGMPDELFEKLHLETERRSPIYQLFSKSGTNITSQWTRHASIYRYN